MDYYKNRNDLESYYNVGKLLIEAQSGEERAKYGDNLIKKYSIKLTKELGKKCNETLLKNIRRYYIIKNICPMLSDKLSWSHYIEIIWKKNINEIEYYINLTINQNLSVRKLRETIKSNEYERLSDDAKKKLIIKERINIEDNLLNPIVINSFNKDIIIFNEKVLKELILNDIENFMKQLGNGYSFINSEYPILLGDRYNYIDLFLFNYI